MPEVIPAILEKTWEDIESRARAIAPYTNFVQLDVMDGKFVPNETFNDTTKLATLALDLELHLMIERPSLVIDRWAMPNVRRMIVHFEAAGNIPYVINQIRSAGNGNIEAAVAINPGTSTYDIKEYLDDLDMVLVMGVEPGFSGQDFHMDVLEKIRELKRLRPDLPVQVDGGVNEKTRAVIVSAGTDILAAASFIWKAPDIGEAIRFLQEGN